MFRNKGDGTFDPNPFQTAIPNVYRGSVVWGDFDNDGDLDVLLAGLISAGPVCQIYQNQGPSGFNLVDYSLAGIYDGSATFADYDNDGRLDTFCIGNSPSGPIAHLYHNEGIPTNSPPDSPTNLTVSVLGNTAFFFWSPGIDANQAAGHTFNLRVGTSPQAGDVVNPMASASGFRRLMQIGNTDERQSRAITNLAPGTYYWSVQAVDNSFSGSSFAAEESFIVKNVPKISAIPDQRTVVDVPTPEIPFIVNDVETPATDLVLSASSSNTNLVSNQNISFEGSGSNRTVRVIPSTHEMGTTTITVTVSDTDNASARSSFELRVDQFSKLPLQLPGLVYSSVAWGDFDNDGDLDLLVTGGAIDPTDEPVVSRIYRNDGNGIFTDIKAGLPGVQLGNAVWGDYNNDGYLDVLLTGTTNGSYLGPITRIYRNNRDGTFSDIGASISGGYRSFAAWGDYDNDGRLDFILVGARSVIQGTTQIYHNDGSDHFTFVSGLTRKSAVPSRNGAACRLDHVTAWPPRKARIGARHASSLERTPPASRRSFTETPAAAPLISWTQVCRATRKPGPIPDRTDCGWT